MLVENWNVLDSYDLVSAAEAQGYNETTWSNGDSITKRLDWTLLSYNQRSAARQLCYLPVLWEHLVLDDWGG